MNYSKLHNLSLSECFFLFYIWQGQQETLSAVDPKTLAQEYTQVLYLLSMNIIWLRCDKNMTTAFPSINTSKFKSLYKWELIFEVTRSTDKMYKKIVRKRVSNQSPHYKSKSEVEQSILIRKRIPKSIFRIPSAALATWNVFQIYGYPYRLSKLN